MAYPTEIILASASPRRRALLGTLIGHPPRVLTADIDESVQAGEAPEAYARRLAEAKARAVAGRLASETPAVTEAPEVDEGAAMIGGAAVDEAAAVEVAAAVDDEADAIQPDTRAAAASARAATRTFLILGSDTIVVFEGAILGKPADAEAARACLRLLRGRRHEVITAVALVEVNLLVSPGRPDALAAPSRGITEGQIPTRIQVSAATTGVWMRDYSDAEIAAYVDTGDPLDKAGAYAIQHRGFSPVARLVGSESNVIGLPLGLTARMLRRFGLPL